MSFGKRSVFGGQASGGGTPMVALNLTALMDILSNLLFFLLAAYAAQATEVENKSELRLPSSTSQVRLQLQLTISITQSAIQVADAPSPQRAQRPQSRIGKGTGWLGPVRTPSHFRPRCSLCSLWC
jgi:biopolymer transport protein ExbD